MSNNFSFKAAAANSLWKASLAVILFLVLGIFQGKNIIREGVEDFGFDVINEILNVSKQQDEDSNINHQVSVFAFDNDYMKQHSLYDEDNISKFGYIFPRQHVAKFINDLDQHLIKLKGLTGKRYCPKAVFIDIDTSYLSGANGTPSEGDKTLIQALAAPPRCYKLLLARASKYNFIEDAAIQTPSLKENLDPDNPAIIFVSPNFHVGNDRLIRRSEPINVIDGTPYPSAAITLWQIIKNGKASLAQTEQFINDVKYVTKPPEKPLLLKSHRTNVNANRIWMRNYTLSDTDKEESACEESSYWRGLKKFSLNCSFIGFNPSPEYLDKTVLLLGSTERENKRGGLGRSDYHKTFDFFTETEMSGVDIHANSLMTLLYLDASYEGLERLPQLEQLSWYKSLSLVFITLFLVNLTITWLFLLVNIRSDQAIFFTTTVISTIAFFAASLVMIKADQPAWFNWVVGVVLFQCVEGVLFLRKYLPVLVSLLLVRLSHFFKTKIVSQYQSLRKPK